MRASHLKSLAVALVIAPFAAGPALAGCLFGGCDVTDAQARSVFENLLKQHFDKPGKILEFKKTMTEQLEMHATGEKGFEFFFNATVEFPEGANLDCKPDEAGKFKDGCSTSKHYVTSPRTSDPKGKQYVEPGAKIVFDEEYRFYESSVGSSFFGAKGWKGPDGKVFEAVSE
jgi:hypothetical protein